MPRGTLGSAVADRFLPHTITIRRGDATFLAAQPCRIASPPTGGDGQVGAGASSRAAILVYGLPDMDIQRGDVFALEDPDDNTTIYRVMHAFVMLRAPDGVTGSSTPVATKAIAEAQQ